MGSLVEAKLRKSTPGGDVPALDEDGLSLLEVEVVPSGELDLPRLVGQRSREDGLGLALDLNFPPLHGEDTGCQRQVAHTLSNVLELLRRRGSRFSGCGLQEGPLLSGYRGPVPEVDLDLPPELFGVGVLHPEDVPNLDVEPPRLPSREGHGPGLVGQDSVEDLLSPVVLLQLSGIQTDYLAEQIHTRLPGLQVLDGLHDPEAKAGWIATVLLHDAAFGSLKRNPVDVQVVLQFPFDNFLAYLSFQRPGYVTNVGRKLLPRSITFLEAGFQSASVMCNGEVVYKSGGEVSESSPPRREPSKFL